MFLQYNERINLTKEVRRNYIISAQIRAEFPGKVHNNTKKKIKRAIYPL